MDQAGLVLAHPPKARGQLADPSVPGQCPGPQPRPRARPQPPPAHERGSCPRPRPASLPSLGEPTGAHPQEPHGPNCQALGCHGDRGNQGQGRAPQTQPAPPRQGGCSLFVLCSMLGGGQLRRRGHFHREMERRGPLGPGGGAAGRAGVGEPPSSRREEVLTQIPRWGAAGSEVRMEGHPPPRCSQASRFAAAPPWDEQGSWGPRELGVGSEACS